MSIIDKLKNLKSEDKENFKRKFKEAQDNLKIEERLTERRKSSNQRELEGYIKKKNEDEIKVQLEKIHKKQRQDTWKGDSILKGHKSILHEDTKILENDKPILSQKNIFLDNKTKNPITKRGMFFK